MQMFTGAITLGGAKMLGRDDLGRLCKGAKADMIVVNLDSFHMGALDDPIRTMFLCGSGCDVTMSIIDGKTVMKDREIAGVDLQELKAKAQEYYDRMKKDIWRETIVTFRKKNCSAPLFR